MTTICSDSDRFVKGSSCVTSIHRVCLMTSHAHLFHVHAHGRTEDNLVSFVRSHLSWLFFLELFLELSRSQLARDQALRDLPVSASPGLRSQVCTATLGFPSEPSPHVGLIIHLNIREVLSGRGLFLVCLTRREYRKMPLQATLTV